MGGTTVGDYNRTGKCCLCGKTYDRFGHNPDPLGDVNAERCCDDCNAMYVLSVRLGRPLNHNTTPEPVLRRYVEFLNKVATGKKGAS